jgi:transcriptional regulator with XRE-family HTH domain
MVHGEAKMLRRRALAACPDVRALRERLSNYVGLPVTREYLASLVGCSKDAIKGWEKGKRPLAVFAVRLAALEKKLGAKTRTLGEELLGLGA